MELVPPQVSLQGIAPICWAEIKQHTNYEERCSFFDGSKGRADPQFKYVVISADRIPGYEECYLVCYFNAEGDCITQTPFDTIQEGFDHGKFVFEIEEYEWRWPDPTLPEKLGINL